MPKVSFIMPAYKKAYIKEAVQSILAQTSRDFEIVIVDDNSPENLWEEIGYIFNSKSEIDDATESFVDGVRIRYYRNEHNIGGKDLVAAWENAIRYAEGDWIVCAGDDDVYMPSYLETMLQLMDKYPNVDLFHCRLADIDANGAIISIGEERIELETQAQMLRSVALLTSHQALPEFMFRKSALEREGGFPHFETAIDSDDAMWIILAKNGVVCSSEILFHFRLSGINISSRKDNRDRKIRARIEFLNWGKDFIPSIIPKNDEDALILKTALQAFRAKRLFDIACEAAFIPFSNWKKLRQELSLTKSEWKRFCYIRIKRYINAIFR